MARSRFPSLRSASRVRRDRTTSVLLVALGTVAGIALGMVIADRTGGIHGLLRRAGGGHPGRARDDDAWDDAEGGSDDHDHVEGQIDDDSELSPESIAHMHVHAGSHEEAMRVATESHQARAVRETRGTRDPREQHAARKRSKAPASSSSSVSTAATVSATAAAKGSAGAGRDRSVRELPVRTLPDEAALEARVLEAFMNDPLLRERAIDICASAPGTIELTGWVQASGEIGHALTLARGVPDVTDVVDRLAVRGGEPSRDHSSIRYAGPAPGTSEPEAPRAD